MRTYSRPPLSESDYALEDRGFVTDCWIRIGFRNNKGYTKVSIGGKSLFAHRAMYEQVRGPIPAGLQIDHLCEQTDCINPDHLEPVTAAQNMRRRSVVKLTESDAVAIRSDTRSSLAIAKEYGISASHAHRIRAGEKWRVVPQVTAGD